MNEPTDANAPAPPPAEAPESAGATDPKGRFEQAARDRQGEDTPEEDLWEGAYSHKAMVGSWVGVAVGTLVAIVAGLLGNFTGRAWGVLLVLIGLAWVVVVGLYLYRRYSVHYSLTTQRLIHEAGLVWRTVDRVELIDVDDVTFRQGPIERMLGVGTIQITSSDRTTPELALPGIDGVRDVADTIDDARRKERRSRGLHIEAV